MAEPYEVLGVIGEDALLRLQIELGASWVYIPVRANNHCDLAKAIGPELAAKLTDKYPGERTWVGTDLLRRCRNAEIKRLSAEGHNAASLGERFSLTKRSIANIK